LGSEVILWKNGVSSGSCVAVVVSTGSGKMVLVGMRVDIGSSVGVIVEVLN